MSDSPSSPSRSSFSFDDYHFPGTFLEMSDEQFALLVAFSSERAKGNTTTPPSEFRNRFYFDGGEQLKKMLAGYGINKENAEGVLRGLRKLDWFDIFIVPANEHREIIKASDPRVWAELCEDSYDLSVERDNGIVVQFRSYVLDKFEEFCPGHKWPHYLKLIKN